jgi:hypothetical protein
MWLTELPAGESNEYSTQSTRIGEIMPKATLTTGAVGCLALALVGAVAASAQNAPKALTARLSDFIEMPLTGDFSARDARSQPARINFLVEEPEHGRLFVSDCSGPLYILDKKTRQPIVYLNFNGSGDHKGLFELSSSTAAMPAVCLDSHSIPTMTGMASSTHSTWRTRPRRRQPAPEVVWFRDLTRRSMRLPRRSSRQPAVRPLRVRPCSSNGRTRTSKTRNSRARPVR